MAPLASPEVKSRWLSAMMGAHFGSSGAGPVRFVPEGAALAGAVALGVRALARRETTVAKIADALDVPFLAFVLCLGVVVAAVMLNGLDGAMRDVLPDGDALTALLGIAAVAALLSNIVNNLPAVLVLLPLVAASGPAAVAARGRTYCASSIGR